jgi:rubredoxin
MGRMAKGYPTRGELPELPECPACGSQRLVLAPQMRCLDCGHVIQTPFAN